MSGLGSPTGPAAVGSGHVAPLRTAPCVVLYERERRFEAKLRRGLAGSVFPVRVSRRKEQLFDWLREAPGSLFLIDLAVGVDEARQLLWLALSERLECAPMILVDAIDPATEWSLRELGAVSLIDLGTPTARLAQHCLSWFARHASRPAALG